MGDGLLGEDSDLVDVGGALAQARATISRPS